MAKPKSPRDWESWIDQQIREAQERGEFDNLPGRGKPLDLTPNPHARDQELAFKILKDAGYAPEWIELDKGIRGKLENARLALVRSWEWRQARLHELGERSGPGSEEERSRVEAGWQQAIAAFKAEGKAINREILELNLKVPGSRFQRSKVDPSQEVERLTKGERVSEESAGKRERMAETVREVVTRRERAPRSPGMARALKRLIWRYTRSGQEQKQDLGAKG
jgi:DnaJ family protein C protein 28